MKRTIGLVMMIGLVVGAFDGCGYLIKTHTEKYDNGKMSGEGNYIDGKEEGKEITYYESGKVQGEANYIDGKEEGKEITYYESGKIVDEDIWKDGECVEMCEGDE